MRNRWLLNIGLALFIVGLLVWVHLRPPGRHKHPHYPALTALKPAGITRIRLSRPGHRMLVIAKSGRGWHMTKPVSARADRFRVADLLHVTDASVHDSFTVSAAELGKYGLTTPLATLWLNHQKIEFGDENALGGLQYVLYRGRVALIPAYSFNPASMQIDNFYSSRLIEKNRKPVAFVFPKFRLTSHQGVWHLEPPDPHLSSDAVNSFVDEWRYARALSVSRYHGAKVTGQVLITYRDRVAHGANVPHTLVIDIIERAPELVLYRPDEGLEYHFPAQMGRHLLSLLASH
ncbi:MAG: DUF4340 domain-containing protein [Acidiferrobacteraceae bacterium]